MKKKGEIEILTIGKYGSEELNPENFDIQYIAKLIQGVEDLLFPTNKKNRPLISYDISGGSVLHVFKTSMQVVIGFSAILTQVQSSGSIDFLELKSARAIEDLQNISIRKNYEFRIKTSLSEGYQLSITPKTKFFLTGDNWAEAEFYFYGILKDAGGKSKANIHLDTEDFGYLTIDVDEEFLKGQEKNLLYKEFGVRAIGKQNTETGEIDLKSLRLLELIDYSPKFDEDYLKRHIARAKNNWEGVDADEWLQKLRGNYEA